MGKKLPVSLLNTGADEKFISLNPHAPYSVSDELWKLLETDFEGKTITIHNQESLAENEFFMTGKGDLTPMYTLMKMDSSHFNAPGVQESSILSSQVEKASRVLLVHNTYMNEADLNRLWIATKICFFVFVRMRISILKTGCLIYLCF